MSLHHSTASSTTSSLQEFSFSSSSGTDTPPSLPSSPSLPAIEDPTPAFTISEALDGSTILVTGAAGFVGSAILFRLLCDPALNGIKKVVAVVRGKTVEEATARLSNRLTSQDRLVVVNGDCGKFDFGLEGKLRDEIHGANIVIHAAGDTRFTLPLSQAMASITDLAYKTTQFSLLSWRTKTHIHLSTTFVSWFLPTGSVVSETLVPPNLDKILESHQTHVNTYFHAKSLAEASVDALSRSRAGCAPHGKAFRIIRLSTIGPAVEFPSRGWGSGHTSSPLCAAIAAEVVENTDVLVKGAGLDVIPIDIAVNQVLALTASAHFSHQLERSDVRHPRHPLNPINAHGTNVPVYHIAAGLERGSNMPITLLNSLDVKIEDPYVPQKNIMRVYEPFLCKLVAFETANTRRVVGLKPVTDIMPFEIDFMSGGNDLRPESPDEHPFGRAPPSGWSDLTVNCQGFEVDTCGTVARIWGQSVDGWRGYVQMVRDEMEERGRKANWNSYVD